MLPATPSNYSGLLESVSELLKNARRASVRAVNVILTSTYWEIGRRIVEFEQVGKTRAQYGEEILTRLAHDLTTRFGRGFSLRNLRNFRAFYLGWPIRQTPSAESSGRALRFPLPWSAYVRLLAVKNEHARAFYETETLHGGWSVRQLDRQINSRFYERTALSKDKKAMLIKGRKRKPGDLISAEEEIKDPYVLEFLNLKDEYSEGDLEDSLVRHLESFLLELGGDFCFVGRQKRLRIGDEWYRVDLVFFHRRLRCLVIIDLKLGKFTHADAGQMHLYLNYAREHWTRFDENPPVGLILCADKNAAVAKYALEGLPNKVVAAEYKLVLPKEDLLISELKKTQRSLIERQKPCKRHL